MKEIEVRSFISAEVYSACRRILDAQATLVESTRQITHYLDSEVDTRIQLSTSGGRMWQKKGKMHDPSREEIEVLMSRDDASKVHRMFSNMAMGFKVSWYRYRRGYQFNGVTIALDETVGYGRILEAEIMADEGGENDALARVNAALKSLGVEPTPKAVFDEAFRNYMAGWKALVPQSGDVWLDSAD